MVCTEANYQKEHRKFQHSLERGPLKQGWLWLVLCIMLTPQAHSEQSALDLIKRLDDLYRLDSSVATITMEIHTEHWQRSMTMEAWSQGMDFTLVRILSPKKEKGISTLKRHNEMWNFFPKIRKVIKVPPSMMMGSWMGSDFTNDDLVREESLADDYEVNLSTDDKFHTLTLIPKANTVTVWGKIIAVMDKQNLLPIKQTYFDEDGTSMREMLFSNNRNFDGRLLPAVMTLKPLNKPEQFTRLTYDTLEFNPKLKPDLFTLRTLKKRK